jgi:hypothetical protein
MRASGYLTTNGSFNSTSGSPSLAGDMDSATVYAFLSDLNGTNDGGSSGEKNCGNPAYRYGGVLWLTATSTATINWGAWTANANSAVCYPVYGSRDYMHANWGTTCNWSAGGSPGINYRVLSISLSPANIKYQADATLDGTGDFEFVWDSCSTFYQSAASTGKVVKTGIPKGARTTPSGTRRRRAGSRGRTAAACSPRMGRTPRSRSCTTPATRPCRPSRPPGRTSSSPATRSGSSRTWPAAWC